MSGTCSAKSLLSLRAWTVLTSFYRLTSFCLQATHCSLCAPCLSNFWRAVSRQVQALLRVALNDAQAGLNGVDNGQIWFDHVRVTRDALLDRYASVAADGTYSSPIPSVAQRFGTMVGGLTTVVPHTSSPVSELRRMRI